MGRIKVAHITTAVHSLKYLLFNQLESIRQAGYEVTGISAPGEEAALLEGAGIRHIEAPLTRTITPMTDLRALWGLWRILRREKFTIVHTHTAKPDLIGQVAAHFAGVPIVVSTLHGFYFHDLMRPRQRKFFVLLAKIGARYSNVVLSQNREDMETAVREGICRREQIRFLGNGIDVRRFDRTKLDEAAVQRTREELGIAPEAPVVGFVGRLVREKGILEVLQAARVVRREIPGARFLFAGLVDEVKADAVTPEVAAGYGLAEAAVFTGLRQDMPELFAQMDVFALPSHREGFPRAPMEASAMGVPSVVTDIRGCREAVEEGRNGLLVPLGDAEALARAILRLLRDKKLAREMGRTGRRMALERFDERLVFERVKQEYARLLRESGLATVAPQPQGSG